jgi:hypothetical protein
MFAGKDAAIIFGFRRRPLPDLLTRALQCGRAGCCHGGQKGCVDP